MGRTLPGRGMTLATIDATLGYLIYALCLWVGLRIVLGLAYCAARGYADYIDEAKAAGERPFGWWAPLYPLGWVCSWFRPVRPSEPQ